jgi:hypothetical protein
MAPARRGSNAGVASAKKAAAAASASVAEETPKAAAKAATAPAHHGPHYEFGGPYLGPIGIMVGLPLISFAYATLCGGTSSSAPTWPNVDVRALTVDSVVSAIKGSWDTEVFLIYVAYFLMQVVFYLALPAKMQAGVPLKGSGKSLTYPMNGLHSLVLTVAVVAAIDAFKPFGDAYTWVWIYDHWSQLITSTIVFSFALSVFLYWHSFQASAGILADGAAGIPLYDFFLGRELNPRVLSGQLDLKFFCELRPGLVMWLLINISSAYKQMALSGASRPDLWMLYVVAAQGYYVLDSVLNEAAILTTMDIVTDGFGFMLAFGDLAWVPSVYSLQARFLAERHGDPATTQEWATLAGVVVIGALGMYIFRQANSQKDVFKRDPKDPSVASLPTIPTSFPGRSLLAGGWWAVARHINYFGDWLMSLSWSAATGIATPLTYFYPFYFAILLVHRDMRDEEKCAAKYGEAWKKYTAKVPYRIVPYVY